jgi:hypothetical protein
MKTPSEYKQMEYRDLIELLVRKFKPEIYVEFGVKKCYTFNHIAPLVKLAVGVDINPAPIINLPHVEFYQMNTHAFEIFWREEKRPKIDFLFIDADHSYRAVLNDVVRMTAHLKPFTSLIFLHDTYPIREELLKDGYCNDAWYAASQIKAWPDFEIITLPGPWAGFSILRYIPYGCHGWMDNNIPTWLKKAESQDNPTDTGEV